MKRSVLIAAFGLLFAGCGTPATLVYNVTFDTTDKNIMSDLATAGQHVMERRLAALGGSLIDYKVNYDEKTNVTIITAEVDTQEHADALNAQMTEPFTLDVRVTADKEEPGDIVIKGQGIFHATDVTKDDFGWMTGNATEGDALQHGQVTIGFTEKGSEKMRTLFRKYDGKAMGIFVRGMLVAKIKLQNEKIDRTITIKSIPSREIAEVFADDMNVGLHMTFTTTK